MRLASKIRDIKPRAFALIFLVALSSYPAIAGDRDCPADRDQFTKIQRDAEQNNAEAQTILASCYELGRNVDPNGKEAIRWLTRAAELGYAPAEYELGRTYLYGRGIPADYQLAFLWEKKAAEQGEREAQRDLAFMYERGFGVEQNPAEAANWNRKVSRKHSYTLRRPWKQRPQKVVARIKRRRSGGT